jgi:hypothetical protein
VPGGNYCGIGGQATGVYRQRVLAVEVMQVDGHGAMLSRTVHTLPDASNRLSGTPPLPTR